MSRSPADPLHVFRFRVDFSEASLAPGGSTGESVPLAQGAFSECTGLEATMEPKVIKEGGRNYGAAQRAGPVTFGTVVLKRGLVQGQDLWSAFSLVAQGGYAYRLDVKITIMDAAGDAVMAFWLDRAMPVKLKVADLSARATEVGVEELHLAHEGLTRLP